jgi:hypothetical protein
VIGVDDLLNSGVEVLEHPKVGRDRRVRSLDATMTAPIWGHVGEVDYAGPRL